MESLSSQDALDAWGLSHASPRCTIAVWTLWVHPSMTHPKVRTSQNHLTISTFSTSAHATSHGPRSSSLLFSTTSVPHISTFFKLLGVATSKNHKGKFGVGHHRKPQRTTVESSLQGKFPDPREVVEANRKTPAPARCCV